MSKLTNCLTGKETTCFPIWFMRQAGRYLPEFRKIRSKHNNFIKLCLNSDLSSEITLQPIKRFDLDAAIIFSDILMVPYALGQKVNFVKNEGPILSKLNLDSFLSADPNKFTETLHPVYEIIKKTRKKLNKEKSLISFVGSPWTIAVYMLGLKKGKKNINKDLVIKKKSEISLVLNKLVDFLSLHIKNQINAGSDVVQIFDSWAGSIPPENLFDYCYSPNSKLVQTCKEKKTPVICFPKGLREKYIDFNEVVNPDCINIDYELKPDWVLKNFNGKCIQGGMDPKILLLEEEKIYKEAEKYLKIFKNYPYIFNLGHGLLPETNPDKVKKLVNFIRNYK
jgi:uroporphyrinogen decarboxylase|tara:strand:+ start:22 stop:1032 length:1011 start_codon:yes stop_codon:yes gene_type:complete